MSISLKLRAVEAIGGIAMNILVVSLLAAKAGESVCRTVHIVPAGCFIHAGRDASLFDGIA